MRPWVCFSFGYSALFRARESKFAIIHPLLQGAVCIDHCTPPRLARIPESRVRRVRGNRPTQPSPVRPQNGRFCITKYATCVNLRAGLMSPHRKIYIKHAYYWLFVCYATQLERIWTSCFALSQHVFQAQPPETNRKRPTTPTRVVGPRPPVNKKTSIRYAIQSAGVFQTIPPTYDVGERFLVPTTNGGAQSTAVPNVLVSETTKTESTSRLRDIHIHGSKDPSSVVSTAKGS